MTFKSAGATAEQRKGLEAAALFEVSMAGKKHQMWLQRNSRQYGADTLQTSKGRVEVSFGYARHPLDFSVELIDFTRELNPGGMGDASYSSVVKVVDKSGAIQKHKVAMNEPAEHDKFTFFQSSFSVTSDGRNVSILTAAYDPGRPLKYAASAMICLGAFVIFYLRGRI